MNDPAVAPLTSFSTSQPHVPLPPVPERSANRLTELLSGLSDAATGDLTTLGKGHSATQSGSDSQRDGGLVQRNAGQPEDTRKYENRLAMVRLGMATSLFYALRTKYAPAAAHSLRVALSCSAWCERLGIDEPLRDRIEVASLMHDIGKIGIPDRILRKPGRLSDEEQMTMQGCAEMSCEILRGCTDDVSVLEIVRHGGTWFESRRDDDGIRGDALPLGARMLAIADAFDAMTTDQVHRGALSRERALQELFRGSSTQFDPELAHDFASMLEKHPEMLHECIVHRWLQQLGSNPGADNGLFVCGVAPRGTDVVSSTSRSGSSKITDSNQLIDLIQAERDQDGFSFGTSSPTLPFYQTLSDQLRDGVAFTDREGQILYWNDTMAYMTRAASAACVGKHWENAAMKLMAGGKANDDSCPIRECVDRQVVITRSMSLITNRTHEPSTSSTGKASKADRTTTSRKVILQVSPVPKKFGGGTVVILRDVSDRAEMQNQIQTLHKKATSDPLTGAANRAEFDSRLMHCTAKAKQQGVTFSLIMCDIDHFKKVNDVHGHQAGDEALIQFTNVLENHTRGSDLVARYGGEEFAFLAINSDNATATRRAEEIRRAVASTPLKGLGGESVTVSMGVTEYQTGDAPETVIARADRALMTAKENGRNRVVQLGGGLIEPESKVQPSGWLDWLTGPSESKKQEFMLVTPVPTDLAVEKLRGFIADHRAEIISVSGTDLSLRINVHGGTGRRAADHRMTLNASIHLSESRGKRGPGGNSMTQTQLRVSITPIRNRDRRGAGFAPCVRQVVNSLKSYLMAELVDDHESDAPVVSTYQ